jgi:nucleotide-binding universal stress UspA family protein
MPGAPVETDPPLRHVLACTDFSVPARQAAERAARIAGAQGATLHLLHTVAGGTLDGLKQWLGAGSAAPQHVLARAHAELRALASDLARAATAAAIAPARADAAGTTAVGDAGPAPWRHEGGPEHDPEPAPERPPGGSHRRTPGPVHCHIETGSVTQHTQRYADALPADLVVLGARGAGTLRRLVLGTTPDRLLRLLRQPVLVVRNPASAAYRRVVVAVDFSPWSALAVQTARRVAPGAPLLLLNVTTVPFGDKLRFAGVQADTIDHYRRQARAEALQRLHALAHDLGLEAAAWRPRVMEGEAWQCIVQAEEQEQADLLVLGKQGCTAAEDLLLGSVTLHVLAEGSADVLVCTARAVDGGAPP